MTRDDEIDVAQELENNQVEGARGGIGNDGGRRRTPGVRIFMYVIILTALVIGGLLTWKAWERAAAQKEADKKPAKVENTLPPLKPHAPQPDVAATQPAPVPVVQPNAPVADAGPNPTVNNGPPQPSPEEVLRNRRLGGGFTGNGVDAGDSGSAAARQLAALGHGNGATGDSLLESQLTPLALKPSKAGMLGDRNYLITRGAMIDCGQQSKLVTDQAGMVVCYTTSDTYSANGHVVLIDAGSKIVGSYQTGIKQGQNRVFVAWQRIETPQGVIVDLDSPGTDSLGAAGEPGYVDTHFWQRFGGAIMLSVLGDAGEAAIAYAQNSRSGGNTNIGLGNTQNTTNEMATEALRNTINIPPTLYKNQGDRVSIFIARDLDFNSVYSIR
ncbi:Inner membrane protein of type IV secretion of T-DNA complex, TonB-like, VirB10 [Candidatus Burkholderia verschuerenii]|uniref:Inner membrane protein of type IV secretion of T-DNA complex, TonB-like, VirB10 n=1 Tax=Candidatus Burkholderia verschuerenii TaxID=242163 RepID=A0A0L0ME40_9BURK|nr:type IV secretion system protein VirB10 [Candidatus Burkholderia verschuerenii]KND60583.1 Inner membrane protein of type IV secretion of T-DNA complex, TonB-like, VirB10 [Candidatus Burkholderia verschuerenii]